MIRISANGRAIVNGNSAAWKPSPNVGGALVPQFIVLHDTASGLSDAGPIDWLTNPISKVSAHVVIGRDGKITQLVPFNVKAWHAGVSAWRGRQMLNGFSVGIEIVNPGKLIKMPDGTYGGIPSVIEGADGKKITKYKIFDTAKDPSLVIQHARTNPHGDGHWLAYTNAQVQAVTDLCMAIASAYPIEEVVTHWLISPGRKIDTNPLFPLEQVRAAVAPSLQKAAVKPVAIADLTADQVENVGGSEVSYQGDDYHAPVGTPDTDESAGGSVGFLKRARNYVTTALSSVGIGGVAALSNWQIAALLFGGVLLIALVLFLIALWLYGKQNVAAWIARHIT